MADRRFRSSRRFPDASNIQDLNTRVFSLDLVAALADMDRNVAQIPINKTLYPLVSVANVVSVVQTLLDDLQKAGIIK